MIGKIISPVIVIAIHAVLAFVFFGIMLLSMNGYNDAAAEAAMPAYLVSQVIFIIFAAGSTVFLVWLFQDKIKWNAFLASFVSIIIAVLISCVLTFVAMGIGIGFGDMAFRR